MMFCLLPRCFSRYCSNIPLYLVLVVPYLATIVGTVTLVGYLSYRSGQQGVKIAYH
ncbi:MAG: hypothetical protein HC827_09235 [Cyanobacteria bacterium RM1_2_2]|nr:hypothetical protein [Cyanobacteria bacterium RM1_2_2]